MRTFIIGDIHGCYEQLVNVLYQLGTIEKEDKVIFVGDYFDRGSKSFEVLKLLQAMKNSLGDRLVLIRGNHEQMMLDYYSWKDRAWDWNGNESTIKSFEENGCSPKDYLEWIDSNTVLYHCGDTFDVVHAGRLEDDFDKCSEEDLIWDRYPFRCNAYDGKLTFIGHTPIECPALSCSTENIVIYEYGKEYNLPEKGLINIDTGCVFGNKLTAVEIKENKMIFHHNKKSDN